jgi:hypothetical protein
MKGVEYIIDDRGKKRAAIIDLNIYRHLWEDIHDILMIESRKEEPRIRWENVKEKMRRRVGNDEI